MSTKTIKNNTSLDQNFFQTQGDMLNFMSHELRTPLNAILGYAELITKEVHGPIQPSIYKEYIEAIKIGGDHLLALVNDILDYSKLHAGKMTLYEQQIDLSYLLSSCIKLFDALAQKKEIKLSLKIKEKMPLFFADERIINQIIMNLLSNAIKYTYPNGIVQLEAFVIDEKICIHIKDSGIGMNPQEIKLALEPFGQINILENQDIKGTGLGLPLVKALTELHEGTLEIESQKNVGTQFTLIFPTHRTINIII
jgi:signal transduction histidine kinase